MPTTIWSDNGTNFQGANWKLNELQSFLTQSGDLIINSCANQHINWKFIPANSSHFGGLWESAVKSTKRHLLTVINETKLTYEEFITILSQVEAMLNSRPLFPLSSHPNDLTPLTPAHFLVGRPLISIPQQPVMETPVNRLTRYQLMQQITQSFWRRRSYEYLHHCQQRFQWKKPNNNIELDAVVLIKQNNLPPNQWFLGRVCELLPSPDQVVRVVSVHTSHGVFRRSVTKICPLPTVEDDDVIVNSVSVTTNVNDL